MMTTNWRKSSRSGNGEAGSACVEARWRKSSRSGNGDAGSNCVEARATGGEFQVRDSKLSDDSPVFGLAEGDFIAFLESAKR
jgi:hypothetical protein